MYSRHGQMQLTTKEDIHSPGWIYLGTSINSSCQNNHFNPTAVSLDGKEIIIASLSTVLKGLFRFDFSAMVKKSITPIFKPNSKDISLLPL